MIVDNDLRWCDAKQPEYWPSDNSLELAGPDEPGISLTVYNGQLYAFSKWKAWFIQGTGTGVFNPVPIPVFTGSQSPFGTYSLSGTGIYHLGHDGIYLFGSGVEKKITEQTINPIFNEDTNGMPKISGITESWFIMFENDLHFHYGDGSVFVINQQTQKLQFFQYDEKLSNPCIDESNNHLICQDNSGYIRRLYDSENDAGTAIDWEVESKDFTLQTRAHFPRWAKYDVGDRASSTNTVKGEIYLNGSLHQTHQIIDSAGTNIRSYNRNTRKRLIEIGNGERCKIKITGSGPMTIFAVEME